MAKKDNPSQNEAVKPVAPVEDKAQEVVQPAIDVALAPLKERIAELEKHAPIKKERAAIQEVPLTLCNRRYQEVADEMRAQHNNVVDKVTTALKAALGSGRPGDRRTRKDLAPHAIEAKAAPSK